MTTLAAALLAVAVLYITIWPHELAHSAAAYLFGCKANPWQTDVSWFLWGSWAGDVDYACLRAQGGPALALTDFAGIAVNLALLALTSVAARSRVLVPASRRWLRIGAVWWALGNYAEAFSYLVLNTILLASDMKTVVDETGTSRWLWCSAGVVGAIGAARALATPVRTAAETLATRWITARAWRWLCALYVAAVGSAMGAARIVLT